jgi:mannosyltransferase
MVSARWLGSDAPEGIARLGVGDLLRLWGRRKPVIWHARRNDEMIAGVALKTLGWPLRLLFTSAAQRHHSWTTRWLIRRMDAIIATSEISASYLKRPAASSPPTRRPWPCCPSGRRCGASGRCSC